MTTKPYSITELATKWEREQITIEQMLGQLLAHIALLQQTVADLTKQPQPSQPGSNHQPATHAQRTV